MVVIMLRPAGFGEGDLKWPGSTTASGEIPRSFAERSDRGVAGSAAITDSKCGYHNPRAERSRDRTPDSPRLEVYVGRQAGTTAQVLRSLFSSITTSTWNIIKHHS